MAVTSPYDAFNPAVANASDPKYGESSRPISTPEADTTAGKLFAGLGDVISAGAKAGETAVHEFLKEKIYDTVEPIRNAEGAALNTINNVVRGGQAKDAFNLIQPPTNPVPGDLQTGLSNLDKFASVRANGHMSETYYYQRLMSSLTGLRDQFPGYRDFIDEHVKSITGVDPANARIKSLVEDINAASASGKEDRNHEINWYTTHGLPLMGEKGAAFLNAYIAGGPKGSLYSLAGPNVAAANKIKVDQSALELEKLDKDALATKQGKIADLDALNTVDVHMKATMMTVRAEDGSAIITPEQIDNAVNKARTGQAPEISGEQIIAWVNNVKARKQFAFNEILHNWTTKKGEDGLTVAQRLGGTEQAVKRINDNLVGFDHLIDGMEKDKTGYLFTVPRLNTSIVENATRGALTGPAGVDFALLGASHKLGGDPGATFTTGTFLKLDKDTQDKLRASILKIQTQPDLNRIPGNPVPPSGNPFTFHQAVKDGIGEDPANPKITAPEYYEGVIQQIEKLGLPTTSPELKKNLAIGLSTPSNLGVFSKFEKDYIDPQTGKAVRGKFDVYDRMTKPPMVAEMHAQGGTTWSNYSDLMKNSFISDLYIRELSDLSKLQPDLDKLKVAWDNVNYKIIDPQHSLSGTVYSQSIARLNKGITGLVNIAIQEGRDPNTFILETLISANALNPAGTLPAGFDKKLLDSLVNSNRKPEAKQ